MERSVQGRGCPRRVLRLSLFGTLLYPFRRRSARMDVHHPILIKLSPNRYGIPPIEFRCLYGVLLIFVVSFTFPVQSVGGRSAPTDEFPPLAVCSLN